MYFYCHLPKSSAKVSYREVECNTPVISKWQVFSCRPGHILVVRGGWAFADLCGPGVFPGSGLKLK